MGTQSRSTRVRGGGERGDIRTGTSVGSPTSKHIRELSDDSLIDYAVALNRQALNEKNPSLFRLNALVVSQAHLINEFARRGLLWD